MAGGAYDGAVTEQGAVIMRVAARAGDADWGIIQSPFMAKKARTTAFSHELVVGNGRLRYAQTTMLDIYGRTFEHTDENELAVAGASDDLSLPEVATTMS